MSINSAFSNLLLYHNNFSIARAYLDHKGMHGLLDDLNSGYDGIKSKIFFGRTFNSPSPRTSVDTLKTFSSAYLGGGVIEDADMNSRLANIENGVNNEDKAYLLFARATLQSNLLNRS